MESVERALAGSGGRVPAANAFLALFYSVETKIHQLHRHADDILLKKLQVSISYGLMPYATPPLSYGPVLQCYQRGPVSNVL